MLYPLTFRPIFKERIWGGRNLEKLYGKALPQGKIIGESWEVSDRPGDESVIANGVLAGRTLGDLLREDRVALLGPGAANGATKRFPLLIKIIDAQDTLSLQVHPPATIAAQLGGEPKTEMWYVAQAGPGAELFVGLRNGVTRAQFEASLTGHDVAKCFHRIPVRAGDAMFLPSGRVHALGAHIVIFEIQQNSDTTYRVFDWNRVDGQGHGRTLHISESLASIDFFDFEPALLPAESRPGKPGALRPLVKNDLFEVSLRQLAPGESFSPYPGRMEVVGIVEGKAQVTFPSATIDLNAGQFCLFPAECQPATLHATGSLSLLEIFAPEPAATGRS